MSRRLFGKLLCLLLMGASIGLTGDATAATAPVLTSVASRKTHTVSGVPTPFDIPLTPGTPTAIECRQITGASGLQIVFTFDQPVVASSPAPTATITGTGSPTTAAPVFGTGANSNTVILTLSSLIDQGTYTATLNNVASAADNTMLLATSSRGFRTLLGDVNASGTANSTDLSITKSWNLLPVTLANFRCDVNAGGTINSTDASIVKSRNLVSVAGGAWVNTAPTITTIPDQAATSGVATAPVGFTVGDNESPANLLNVSAVSDNQTLMPNTSIAVAGTGASRTISLTPAGGQTGTSVVTVTVSDGIINTQTTFNVNVTAASTLYIATLTAEHGNATTGTGTATLQVNAAGTQAILRFQYSNLTSPKVAEHLHLGAPGVDGPIIYDIDSPTPPSPPSQQADGSYLWIFDPNAGNPPGPPSQVAADIAAGNYYINVHTVNFLNGEIRGQFNAANGSQTFTPPGAPSPQPAAAPTMNDVSRFLTQATFGPSLANITATMGVVTTNTKSDGTTDSYDAWLNTQFAIPTTSIYGDITSANNPSWTYSSRVGAELNSMSPDRVVEAWWHNTITAPDQLRQRVAFAYSQIFVVSSVDDNINFWSSGLATYHDMLANDAFGLFYNPDLTQPSLLRDVTLHPIMGQYLNMRGNVKQTLPAKPNENYAREIMQLFSIGLTLLQPDGTLKLDATGLPIPSYDQTVIEGFAQVFTGYDLDSTVSNIDKLPNLTNNNGVNFLQSPFNNTYHRSMVANGGNHSVYEKDLLSYSGDYLPPFADRHVIQAAGSQSANSTNAELSDALLNIANHPSVGPFICRQLIQRLVGSTPSPAYVYRVAQVFGNDGTGQRGNMKAVIRAILVDREARAPQTDAHPITANPGYGHAREPLLCMSALIRGLHANSNTGYYKLSPTDSSLGQAAYRAPTVFNFYPPDYAQPGVVATAHLTSPELDIVTENTGINYINTIFGGATGSRWTGNDVTNRVDTLDGFNVVNTVTVAGSNFVTVSSLDGLAVGQTVIGNGVPAGTTIAAIAPQNIIVTMSNNATGNVANDVVTIGGQNFTINASDGNNTTTSVSTNNPSLILPGTTTGLAINQAISDNGGVAAVPKIPANTVLAQFANHPSAVLTLSNPVSSSNNTAYTYGTQVKTVTTVANNQTINVTDLSGLAVGQVVAGTGFPVLSYITGVSASSGPGTITVSAAPTAGNSNINMQYSNYASEYMLADASDLTVAPPGVPAAASAIAKLGLLDRLGMQYMGGAMPASMKSRINSYISLNLSRGSGNADLARARAAVNLVISSAQFATEK